MKPKCLFFPGVVFTLLMVLLFSSCSVQKRHYRKGFYIEVLAKHHGAANEKHEPKKAQHRYATQPAKAEPLSNTAIVSANTMSEQKTTHKPVELKKHTPAKTKIIANASNVLTERKAIRPFDKFGKSKAPKDEPERTEKKFQVSALMGLLFSLLILPSFIVGLFFLLSSSFAIGLLLFLLAFLFATISLALSIVAITLHFTNPGKYKGVALAFVGFILAILSIGFILFLFLGFF